jgi:hypothetical protein
MTVFLTPDRKPFTGATYLPEARFAAVLEKVSNAWRENRGEVEAQGNRVVQTFERALGGGGGGGEGAGLLTETEAETRVRALAGEALRTAFKQLDQTYDEARGGFGRRLKFPRPSELNFLVRDSFKSIVICSMFLTDICVTPNPPPTHTHSCASTPTPPPSPPPSPPPPPPPSPSTTTTMTTKTRRRKRARGPAQCTTRPP